MFGDAFNDFQVPYRFTTREFNELLASHLAPDGLYLLNVIDSVRFEFLRSTVRTLRETFPHVQVFSPSADWPPDPNTRATYLIAAAKQAPTRPLPGAVPDPELDAFLRDGKSVLLTDGHAPVDQLLAPAFSQALRGR